jgi:hypothetical protein
MEARRPDDLCRLSRNNVSLNVWFRRSILGYDLGRLRDTERPQLISDGDTATYKYPTKADRFVVYLEGTTLDHPALLTGSSSGISRQPDSEVYESLCSTPRQDRFMASQTVEILAIYYFGAWKIGRGSDWTCMAGRIVGEAAVRGPASPTPPPTRQRQEERQEELDLGGGVTR